MNAVSTIALAIIAQVLAFQTNHPIAVYGVGSESCATAWTSERENSSYTWIMGFWSAANLARSEDEHVDTDGNGVVAEVRKTCDAKPSLLLVNAANITYRRLTIRRTK